MKIVIPTSELVFEFSRSGGAGGQNVNKVNTKVMCRWKFDSSLALNIVQKKLIAKKLKNRINEKGEVVIYSQSTRSQVQNKNKAVQEMNRLVNHALYVAPKRKPTRVPRNVKEKRLKEKKIISEKKKTRKKVVDISGE